MARVGGPLLFKDTGERGEQHIEYEGDLYIIETGWFTLKERGHERRGLKFELPLEYPEYSKEIQETLMESTEGEYIRVKVKARNERETKWRVYSIVETDIPHP